MELTGRIIAVQAAKSGSSSKTGTPWMMQEFVIEVPGQYPRRCAFTVFGEDRLKQLNIQMGEDLTVQFYIDAREYHGKWYNDFRAYNVIREQVIPQSVPTIISLPGEDLPFLPPLPDSDDPFKSSDGSDLPFF